MEFVNVLFIDHELVKLDTLLKEVSSNERFLVHTAHSVETARTVLKSQSIDIVVSELDLPDGDGIEVIEIVRSVFNSKALIAILTHVKDHFSQVTVLNHGADDFLQKPVNPRLFVKRLEALARRLEPNFSEDVKEIGDVRIDYGRYMVTRKNSKVELQKKEFELVDLLANDPDRIFTREEIKKQLWNDFDDVRNRTIDVHIRKLRSKLGDDFIHTIKGVGYRF